MFETRGTLNEDTIKELKKYTISSKRRKFIIIFSIICSLLGLLSIVLGGVISDTFYILYGVFFEVLAAILIWVIFYVQYIFQKKNMEMIKEVYDGNGFEIKTFFNEDCAIINNLSTYAKIEIKYEYF